MGSRDGAGSAGMGGAGGAAALGLALAVAWGTGAALAQPAAGPLQVAPTEANTALGQQLRSTQANPALAAAAQRQGARVAAVCAHCHGQNGNSVLPDTPNLAGQDPGYLLEQMQRFADGRRRNEFMEGLIKAMSAAEKVSAALYFAQQPVVAASGGDPALRAAGKAHYERVCFVCHGSDGRGSEGYARLAGQQAGYVGRALRRYRDGSTLRADPRMAAATQRMTERDIDAVAAYVASMP